MPKHGGNLIIRGNHREFDLDRSVATLNYFYQVFIWHLQGNGEFDIALYLSKSLARFADDSSIVAAGQTSGIKGTCFVSLQKQYLSNQNSCIITSMIW